MILRQEKLSMFALIWTISHWCLFSYHIKVKRTSSGITAYMHMHVAGLDGPI